ncbi:MAG: sensor histidine kinase, partial [Cyanobacteria bacterium P01_H01_bin.121]
MVFPNQTAQTASMFQATRRRLAIWYTVVTALLLFVFALGFLGYVRATLIERIDDTLSHVAALVERSLILEPTEAGLIWTIDGRVSQTVNVEASFRNNALVQEDDDRIDLEWFGPDQTLLWSTFTDPPDLPLQLDRKSKTILIPQTRYDEPVLLRQLT